MIHLNLLVVGSLKENWLREGCAEYIKRIGLWGKISITEIDEFRLPKTPSIAQIDNALEKEAVCILEKIPKNSKIIALCIEGKELSSPELSEYLSNAGGEITLIIGGSHGLSDSVKAKATLRLSMSPMTFPHQLARLMLCEQLYRALSIYAGTKYHK